MVFADTTGAGYLSAIAEVGEAVEVESGKDEQGRTGRNCGDAEEDGE